MTPLFDNIIARLLEDFTPDAVARIEHAIVEVAGGMRPSIPNFEGLRRRSRRRYVKDKFNGANQGELALRFGVSTDTIARDLRTGE